MKEEANNIYTINTIQQRSFKFTFDIYIIIRLNIKLYREVYIVSKAFLILDLLFYVFMLIKNPSLK